METEAGTLNDLFFMKYRLEHYDVPPGFSQQRTIGVRVFDDDEAGQVAQISLAEKRMQLFLFLRGAIRRAESRRNSEGWRYIEQEGWTGAVEARKGVLFMAAVRGAKRISRPTSRNRKSRECQGGELNSRPRAYESLLLPLSYPGEKFLLPELPVVLNH